MYIITYIDICIYTIFTPAQPSYLKTRPLVLTNLTASKDLSTFPSKNACAAVLARTQASPGFHCAQAFACPPRNTRGKSY